MKHLEMKGKACPIPVVEARKLLQDEETEAVTISVDNETATNNLKRLAGSINGEYQLKENGPDDYTVVITKGSASNGLLKEEKKEVAGATAADGGNLVVVITSKEMGSGASELGEILIKGFIYSLTQLDIPPSHVIFLNAGAFLTAEGANTLEDLKTLEKGGTVILTCGTCANYYELTEKLSVGTITDMYGITDITTSAGKTMIY